MNFDINTRVRHVLTENTGRVIGLDPNIYDGGHKVYPSVLAYPPGSDVRVVLYDNEQHADVTLIEWLIPEE